MKINSSIEILKKHNKWRRGDDSIKQEKPDILGKAIDTVVQDFEKKERKQKIIEMMREDEELGLYGSQKVVAITPFHEAVLESVMKDILKESEEVISTKGRRFNGVHEAKIKEVFARYGFEYNHPF